MEKICILCLEPMTHSETLRCGCTDLACITCCSDVNYRSTREITCPYRRPLKPIDESMRNVYDNNNVLIYSVRRDRALPPTSAKNLSFGAKRGDGVVSSGNTGTSISSLDESSDLLYTIKSNPLVLNTVKRVMHGSSFMPQKRRLSFDDDAEINHTSYKNTGATETVRRFDMWAFSQDDEEMW